MTAALAAVWRLDDAFGRFRRARLAFLGDEHPDYKDVWLALAREQYSRRRAAFAKVKAAEDDSEIPIDPALNPLSRVPRSTP